MEHKQKMVKGAWQLKFTAIVVCVMIILPQIHATIEREMIIWFDRYNQSIDLFHRGEAAASAEILRELSIGSESGIIGRAKAADALCDVVKYLAAQNSDDMQKWSDILHDIEMSLKSHMIAIKEDKGRDRVQQSLDRLRRARNYVCVSGEPNDASPRRVQEILPEEGALTEDDLVNLLDDIARMKITSDRVPLAIAVLKKMYSHAELPEEVLALLAHGELAIRQEEENPIQAIKHYEEVKKLFHKIKPEEIRLTWGEVIGNKIDALVRHASISVATSPWASKREEIAIKDADSLGLMLERFSSAVTDGNLEIVEELFHPDSRVLSSVLSVLQNSGIVKMEYVDLQRPVLSVDGDKASVVCVVRITKQVGKETSQKSGAKTVVFRKHEQKWLIDSL